MRKEAIATNNFKFYKSIFGECSNSKLGITTIDTNGILQTRYGHETVRIFANISIESRDSLIYADDAENCYIIKRQSGNILLQEKKRQESFIGKPCYEYLGTFGDGKPIFYDAVNSGYIIPRKNGYIRRKNFLFKKLYNHGRQYR